MNWVSVVNFIRLEDVRNPALDHLEPVVEQLKVIVEHSLPATWLLQIDAILEGPVPELFRKSLPINNELGLWFEMNRLHCEYAGVPFRGRDGINWDPESKAAFSIGYTQEERKLLADAAMDVFRKNFGRFPESVAAWYIDAFSLEYMKSKYGIVASANCRDQWGTDGYSIWGGFWGGGYYPCRNNAFLPARATEDQIDVPIFRMLGSCPINQYDAPIGKNGQAVCTLEPAYNPSQQWIDMFYENMFSRVIFDYSFVQVGQENSFGWPRMRENYLLQIKDLAKREQRGELSVATLADIGKWYLRNYSATAPFAVVAEKDSTGSNRKSYWYNSRKYRVNLIHHEQRIAVRDLHLFDAAYRERYLKARCEFSAMVVDSLPVVEGFLWNAGAIGKTYGTIEVMLKKEWSTPGLPAVYSENLDGVMQVSCKGDSCDLILQFNENSIVVTCKSQHPWRLVLPVNPDNPAEIADQKIFYNHNGFRYSVTTKNALGIEKKDEHIYIPASADSLLLLF